MYGCSKSPRPVHRLLAVLVGDRGFSNPRFLVSRPNQNGSLIVNDDTTSERSPPAQEFSESEPHGGIVLDRLANALFAVRWPLALLALVLCGWTALAIKGCGNDQPPTIPEVPKGPKAISQNYFDALIAPLARENDAANREAAERCITKLEDCFARYKRGVGPFANDVTSLGTRFSILRKMPYDWWKKQDNVGAFVKERFEKHVFSGSVLTNDINDALETFRQDIRTNRGALLVKVKAAVSEGNFPDFTMPDYDQFTQNVMEGLTEIASDTASESVYNGLAALVTSELASVVGTQVVVRLLPSLATAAAVETATTGGAAAGGAAAGGGAGSAVGPAGAAVGVAVGLAIGLAADWWLTESFKVKLTKQIDDYISSLQFKLIDESEGQQGLRHVLAKLCGDLMRAEDAALRGVILEGSR